MNQRQPKPIVIGLLFVALMLIVPPRNGRHAYDFVFLNFYSGTGVRFETLIIQIFIVAVLTGAYIFWHSGKRDD